MQPNGGIYSYGGREYYGNGRPVLHAYDLPPLTPEQQRMVADAYTEELKAIARERAWARQFPS